VPRLAVVGNLSLDRVDGAPPRVGGPPFHAARALRALAVPALVATKCAEPERALLLPPLLALGLPVEWRAGESTAAYEFSYDGDARAMRVDALGAPWTTEDVAGWLGRALARVRWVHVGALARDEFAPETLEALRAGGGRRLSLDGQGVVRPARTGPLELEPDPDPEVLRHVSILKLSEEEAVALAGRIDEHALDALGVSEVLVTLGSRGAMVLERRKLFHVPARPLSGIDPTGAGDAFAAAYLVGRSRGYPPRASAARATSVVHALLARTPR
jgi:sugar/nucleoside kinase (ribokinase family)